MGEDQTGEIMALPRCNSLCIAGFIALALFGSARAQDVSADIIDAIAGQWLIASEDGSMGCRVTLEKDKTIGGYALKEGTPCGPPWHDELQAWDFSDAGLVLRDATRKTLIAFEEQEGGPWRTPLEVSPKIYFIQDPGTMHRVPVAKAAVGSWVLTDKKGKPLCHISLLDRPSSRLKDAKALELSKDCAASVRRTKIDAWQISEINLVIIGGEDWIFTLLPEAVDSFVSDDKKFYLKRDGP